MSLYAVEAGYNTNVVLDQDPSPPKSRHSRPIFGPCLLWPNG